ncbi:hypothetical protein BIZ37_29785 [Photobacterium sp. BZF1]|uniref:hypothetical protein n=1 Tax=Photobacterium sp. BZF1 TaxID=1904457 RepID=UPI001653AA13|nr:hypothetical protein [Photobacterium sp. BZF1]MBC7006740.1 hypothetical protein [Photobacterium sp. BZF1]
MKILAIPGKMPATQTWLEKIIAATPWSNENIDVHRYNAWDFEQDFNVDTEIEHLPSGHYDVVITKSIGTLVTLKSQQKISWDRLVFIGIAWSIYSNIEKELLPALNNHGLPILIIQESHDPFGSYQEINHVLLNMEHITCKEVTGERHQYSNIPLIGKIINDWASPHLG